MSIAIDGQFATVALSSPSDKPISQSDKLYLIVVGRAENTGFSYSFARNKRVTTGYGPILTDHIDAQISIRTTNPALKVIPLSNTGEKLPAIPSKYEDGRLSFKTSANTIGTCGAANTSFSDSHVTATQSVTIRMSCKL